MKRSWNLRNIFFPFLYSLHGILALIPFLVFVVIVQLPIYIYRLLVIRVAARFYPTDLGKAVTINAQFQATEFLGSGPVENVKYTVIVNLVIKGKLSREELCQLILTNWIHARTSDNETNESKENLRYPEFQQYLESWMGFMFWKWDTAFDINNHIFCHTINKQSGMEENDRFLQELVERLLVKEYPRKRSPWEIHLVDNYKDDNDDIETVTEKTLLVIRLHHAFGDGFAMMYAIIQGLFQDYLGDVQLSVPTNKTIRTTQKIQQRSNLSTFISSAANSLALPIRLLTAFGFVTSLLWNRQYPWKQNREEKIHSVVVKTMNNLTLSCQCTMPQLYTRSCRISVAKLKFIKNQFEVSLSSVLHSSLSAALSKNFKAANPLKERNNLRMSVMLPRGGHQNKLRHHTLGTIIELGTGLDMTHVQRLKAVEKMFQGAKRSAMVDVLFPFVKLFSASLAWPFARVVSCNGYVPVAFSNICGPEVKFGEKIGKPVLSVDVLSGTVADLVVIASSYDGCVTVAMSAKSNALQRSELEQLMCHFCEEIDSLHELAQSLL